MFLCNHIKKLKVVKGTPQREFNYFLECFLTEREKNYSRIFQEENNPQTSFITLTSFLLYLKVASTVVKIYAYLLILCVTKFVNSSKFQRATLHLIIFSTALKKSLNDLFLSSIF